jgi:hypothetical protein
MSDGAEAAVGSTASAPAQPRRARVLAALSIALGAGSFFALPVPMASAFPWVTLALSLVGTITGVAALRVRPRGRIAAGLAIAGLLASLAFPLLVVFVFVRYFNWKG